MAVYTHVSAGQLSLFLERYDLGILRSYEGIGQGVENTNYDVSTDRGRYVLTLFEKRVAAEDLPFFVAFMGHLARAGIPCPAMIPDRDGRAIVSLQGRPAVVAAFMRGATIDQADLTPEHCKEMGALMARMHRAAGDFTLCRPNAMGLQAWKTLAEKSHSGAGRIDAGIGKTIADELVYIEKGWPDRAALPHGAIHADLFPDNVLFQENKISAVLDFYFACNDFFVYDLALAINAWCFDKNGSLDVRKVSAMMDEYQALRPMEKSEKDNLSFMCRAAALRIITTRLHDLLFYDPAALVTPKDPGEYVAKLKFHRHEPIRC